MHRLDDLRLRLIRVVGRRAPWMGDHRTITLAEQRPTGDGDRALRRLPEVEMAVHPASCRRLVIIYPGLNATLDGECRQFTQSHPFRYRRLAERMQADRIAAVIRLSNPASGYFSGGQVAVDRVRRAIDYALAHAPAVCGHRDPELNLMGFSAGAGAAAALASEYQPARMLLVAPSGDAGPQRIVDGLRNYTGRLVLLVGEEDEVVTRDAASLYDDISPAASPKQVQLVPECEHFFAREDHNRLLEETTLKVFAKRAECLSVRSEH